MAHVAKILAQLARRRTPAAQAPPPPEAEEVRGRSLADFSQAGLAVVVRSDLLGEEVLFASDNAPMGETGGRTVYRAQELSTLCHLGPEGARAIHEVKRAFPGSRLLGAKRRTP